MAGERSQSSGLRLPWHRATHTVIEPPRRFRSAVFAALRHHNYRLYWIGALVANTGDWMDQVAFAWLMWELTDSAAYLGFLAFFRGNPILLFTHFGGALADRFERRRLLQVTQSSAMALALLLALLVFTGIVQVWQVLTIAALQGIMMSVNLPTRQALLSDIVDREHLANAIALNSATRNVSRIVGGSLGGLLITLFGTAGVSFLNGLSYIIAAPVARPPLRRRRRPNRVPRLQLDAPADACLRRGARPRHKLLRPEPWSGSAGHGDAGAAAKALGVQTKVTIMGMLAVGLGLTALWRAPRVREVE